MHLLNLPKYLFRLKETNERTTIYDIVRKKFVVLTPEEWVRQHLIHFLINAKKTPVSLIVVEKSLKYNQLKKRADILVYNKNGKPFMLVECKAPEVKITQDVFDQIARYNMSFMVKYLVVSNGINHFCCEMDYSNNSFVYLADIPEFS